jgi:hypothetical protein
LLERRFLLDLTWSKKNMDPKEKLQELLAKHALSLPSRAWVSEKDRWESFVFCIIRQFCDQSSDKAISAVTMLRDLDLLDIDRLASEGKERSDTFEALSYVFSSLGFRDDDTYNLVFLLTHIAQVIQESYGGKIHPMIRSYGEVIRDKLTKAFQSEFISNNKLQYAVSLWLQSAYGFPLPVDRPSLQQYCQTSGIRPEDLWKAGEEIDINLGIVDFLVDQEVATAPESPQEPIPGDDSKQEYPVGHTKFFFNGKGEPGSEQDKP